MIAKTNVEESREINKYPEEIHILESTLKVDFCDHDEDYTQMTYSKQMYVQVNPISQIGENTVKYYSSDYVERLKKERDKYKDALENICQWDCKEYVDCNICAQHNHCIMIDSGDCNVEYARGVLAGEY